MKLQFDRNVLSNKSPKSPRVPLKLRQEQACFLWVNLSGKKATTYVNGLNFEQAIETYTQMESNKLQDFEFQDKIQQRLSINHSNIMLTDQLENEDQMNNDFELAQGIDPQHNQISPNLKFESSSNSKISNNTGNGINTDIFKKVFNSAFGNSDPMMMSSGVTNEDAQYNNRTSDVLSLSCLRQPTEQKEGGTLTGRSCESLWNKITMSNNMCDEEVSIHDFLDTLKIDQLNIGQYLDSLNQIESPDVKKQFIQQPIKLNLQQRREIQYQNVAKSECIESPFQRQLTQQDFSRNSLKGDRPRLFQLFKQPILSNNTGGKTTRNSVPEADDELFQFSNKAGNESLNRMKMIEMKLNGQQYQKNSPYSYSEPRPQDEEMHSQSSNEDNSLRNTPKQLFKQQAAFSELPKNNFSSPVKNVQNRLNVATGVTPLKKLQDIMNNQSNFGGSDDYNMISPSIKKINLQSDQKKLNSFSIKKNLMPVEMEQNSQKVQAQQFDLPQQSMHKSQSHRQDRHFKINPIISNLNFQMAKFEDSEGEIHTKLRKRQGVDEDSSDTEMRNEEIISPANKENLISDNDQKDSFGGFSPGISSEIKQLDDNQFNVQKYNSFQILGPMNQLLLKQKSGNYTQSTKSGNNEAMIEALRGNNAGAVAGNSLEGVRSRLGSNRPTGLNLKLNKNIETQDINRKSSELTPNNPFQCLAASAQDHTSEFFKVDTSITPEEFYLRKQSFEGQQDTPMPININLTDNQGAQKTIHTNIFKRGFSFRKNDEILQFIQEPKNNN